MAFTYVPLLMLAGLIGIHSGVITVRNVSVKTGGSISIPCHYELCHRNNVKYLCKGKLWVSCSYAVKTNQPDNSGKFSISDDTNQRIFTVTINNLTDEDAHAYYWCAVEIDNWRDVKQKFQLSVTTVLPSMSVNEQEIAAFEGGSVTVWCHYKYLNKWCRLGSTCVTDQKGEIDGTTVTVNVSVPDVFTVTMSGLTTESSGWYWFASRDIQMPVHLTVHRLTLTTTMSHSTARTLPTTTQHSVLTSVRPHTAQSTISTKNRAAGESMHDEHKISTKVTILITTLALLVLLVPAAFFGWRQSETNTAAQSDPDVLYSTVVHNRHVAAQKKNHIPEESVTYSTIVMTNSV